MALYHVINIKAGPGETSHALLVTSGARKARLLFVERFGGNLDDVKSIPEDVRSNNGERVIGSWLNDEEPAPTAEEVAKASVLSDGVW
jgi:hypothetical protein